MSLEDRWQAFLGQTESERAQYFLRENKLRSVIFSQQFNREFLNYIFKLSDVIRKLENIHDGANYLQSLLNHKSATLYFSQPSTRTHDSFLRACQKLGLQTSSIRDTSTSSEVKGETPLDTVQTLSEYCDLIIMRHAEENLVEKAAWHLNTNTRRQIPVINAGSGKDQHPTQAILDYYTIYRSFKGTGADGKVFAMVGDLLRGRTVHSNAYLAKNFKDIKLIFCAPPEFQMKPDILEFLTRHNIPFELTDDFEETVKISDIIYLTRIQDEHDKSKGESPKHLEKFSFGRRHLSLMKPHAIVMHPLPRRNEMDPEVDFDPRIKIWNQVRNGMWVRAALIVIIFGFDRKIRCTYPDMFL